jgi:anti-sigma B factor antagonist
VEIGPGQGTEKDREGDRSAGGGRNQNEGAHPEESRGEQMGNSLQISSRREGNDSAVLSLQGEVDVSNSELVRNEANSLLADDIKRLVVDLSATEYLDSAGLGVLVGLLKRVSESDLTLIIAGARPQVRRVFEITKLNRVFTMRDDVVSALREVAR